MNPTILYCHGLSKYFDKVVALEKIDLEINPGALFGLLGPNGAGKTTLIKCIFKFLKPSFGEILYRGRPLSYQDIYDNFGYLPENFIPPQELTGKEFLEILGLSLHVSGCRISSLLKEVELDGKKKVKHYSRGMIQRLGLATALLKDPEFLILDEPTLGLDPIGQDKILSLLKNLNGRGKTIFFSSHNLFQVEKICDRIGIIHQGRMKFVGTIREMLSKYHADSLEQAFLKELEKDA